MTHVLRDKKKLIHRINRIQGQLSAVKAKLSQSDEDESCNEILQLIAACRGAMNGLMAEVIEGHVKHHIFDPAIKPSEREVLATQQLLDVINVYLK